MEEIISHHLQLKSESVLAQPGLAEYKASTLQTRSHKGVRTNKTKIIHVAPKEWNVPLTALQNKNVLVYRLWVGSWVAAESSCSWCTIQCKHKMQFLNPCSQARNHLHKTCLTKWMRLKDPQKLDIVPRSKEIQEQMWKKVTEIFQSGKGYKTIHKWWKHGTGAQHFFTPLYMSRNNWKIGWIMGFWHPSSTSRGMESRVLGSDMRFKGELWPF